MKERGQSKLRETVGESSARPDPGGTWHPAARRVISPNQDARPVGETISLLVIHAISLPPGEFGGPWIDALFTNRLDPAAHPSFAEVAGLRVSAHLLIDRNGVLTQYVPFERRAWHAGESRFGDRKACNDFSIGIELEGLDTVPYTSAQYERLAEVTRWLTARFPAITPERIVGHCHIAPHRKTDPGPAFDWRRYRALLERTA